MQSVSADRITQDNIYLSRRWGVSVRCSKTETHINWTRTEREYCLWSRENSNNFVVELIKITKKSSEFEKPIYPS